MCIFIVSCEAKKCFVYYAQSPDSSIYPKTEWTSRYPPQSIIEIIPGNEADVDRTVLLYMRMFGLENVRGGSLSTVKLSVDQMNQIAAYQTMPLASQPVSESDKKLQRSLARLQQTTELLDQTELVAQDVNQKLYEQEHKMRNMQGKLDGVEKELDQSSGLISRMMRWFRK